MGLSLWEHWLGAGAGPQPSGEETLVLSATLQCPHAGARASSTPWDQTSFGVLSSSPPWLLPGAPPALLIAPQAHAQATPLPSHALQPLPGSNDAPASQVARLGSQCRDGSLPAPPTPAFPLVLEKPSELAHPGTNSPTGCPITGTGAMGIGAAPFQGLIQAMFQESMR